MSTPARTRTWKHRRWAKRFIDEFGEYITGDGVAWLDDKIDTDEMDEMLSEL